MRAALFYNPLAGKGRDARANEIEKVCAVLGEHGFATEATATLSAGSAGRQVRQAIAHGATHIFACGGDGTVHDVLQGLVEEIQHGAEPPVLGIIPMGSANALARHLGLSMSPIEAVRQQIDFAPCTIPVGKIEYGHQHRYFLVMAGAGPDGALVYRMTHADKERLGRLAYYIRAATLFATHPFEWFNLEFVETGSRQRQTMRAVAVMAARVSDLGGLFRKLVGDGQVHHAHLQLIAIRPPAWLSLPAWFALSWLGLSRYNPMMRTMNVDEFDCIPIGKSRVHIQADGEWLGNAPMRVTLVPNAIRLLMRSLPMA